MTGNRRDLLVSFGTAALARGQSQPRPAILLRSSWQTINIGDIAHTPGLLAVLEKHVPGADLILWPSSPLDRGVEPMLQRRFPKLRIVKGTAESADVRDAFRSAGLFVHGSAASVGQGPQIAAFRAETKRPYGFFGVTFTPVNDPIGPARVSDATLALLRDAAFVYTRETASLANVRRAGIRKSEVRFAPDGTFSMDIRDEARAEAFLREHKLEPGRFLCVIPRLRFTPYWKIRTVDPQQAATRSAVNDRFAESDHAKLREAIVAWVRKTGNQVLLCPEMTYQLDIIDPLLYDPLPEDVKPKVVRRKTFWLPDEASSVYRRAAAVVSCENHSPILAVVGGTPCLYVHQPEDGIKGRMWQDVGLKDWYFEVEHTSGAQIAARLLEIYSRGEASRRKARAAASYAQRLQAERAAFLRQLLRI